MSIAMIFFGGIPMTAISKRIVCIFVSIALAIGFSISPVSVSTAQAATKPYMKTAKVKWDLKKNKNVTCKDKVIFYGNKTAKAKVKSLKTTKLKNGKKRTTLTIAWARDIDYFNPKTQDELDRMQTEQIAYDPFFSIVDYDTGKSLESGNAMARKRGVSVKKTQNFIYYEGIVYVGTNGRGVTLSPLMTVKLSITYPKSYKGLCLGVWMGPNKATSADNKFWKGKALLKSTSYYKKYRSSMHWMRIK